MSGSWWSKLFPKKDSGFEMFEKFSDAEAGDGAIIEQLKKIGVNLEQPREVLHYLYVPTQEVSDQAATILRSEGYEVTQRPSADAAKNPPNPWLVLARQTMIVNSETVKAARARFAQLSSETRGEYGGWEAAAEP